MVQIMAWRRPGDKPLSEPVMVSLLGLDELTEAIKYVGIRKWMIVCTSRYCCYAYIDQLPMFLYYQICIPNNEIFSDKIRVNN